MTTEIESERALPEPVVRRGVTEAAWRSLCYSTYPGANPKSVLMVLDYCRARHLDPLKKPCHIVQMEVKNALTGRYEWRDVVLPGVYEYRTTAQRTGLYLGHSRPEYGPDVKAFGVSAPEWCEMTMYREHLPQNAGTAIRIEFPVRVLFREVVVLKDGKANTRWSRAPVQMLTKCCEAAGLREAFPDEIGGDSTADEMDGQRAGAPADILDVVAERPALTKPDGFDDWFLDLQAVADEGVELLATAWAAADPTVREYLTATDPEAWDTLKARALAAVKPAAALDAGDPA